MYQEEQLFSEDMMELEKMFLQSQVEKCEQLGIARMPMQDEDVETDEELLNKNQTDVLGYFKESIQNFCGLDVNGKGIKKLTKKQKKEQVRNYENKEILSKKFLFDIDY